MKKVLKVLLFLFTSILTIVILTFVILQIIDYKPSEREEILPYQNISVKISVDKEITLFTWNIGYAGLGNNMDFFYDGGKRVRDNESKTKENLRAICDFISKRDSVDFFYLQEVDVDSKRTYFLNEFDSIMKYSGYYGYFAKNYDVSYVPVPLNDPMGKVKSGLALFSKSIPEMVVRHAFPNMNKWPSSLFLLDRCCIKAEYQLTNGRKLILINTHNEAFDDGSIRKNQFEILKDIATKEFKKGNYVIIGGDWNTCPLNIKPVFEHFDSTYVLKVDSFPRGWTYVFDERYPSNRSVIKAFDEQHTKTTVIDYFIVSPNVQPLTVGTVDLKFKNSDHNPVIAKFRLKRLF